MSVLLHQLLARTQDDLITLHQYDLIQLMFYNIIKVMADYEVTPTLWNYQISTIRYFLLWDLPEY